MGPHHDHHWQPLCLISRQDGSEQKSESEQTKTVWFANMCETQLQQPKRMKYHYLMLTKPWRKLGLWTQPRSCADDVVFAVCVFAAAQLKHSPAPALLYSLGFE